MFITRELRSKLLKSLKSEELYIEFLSLECVEGKEENQAKCEEFKKKLIENNEVAFLEILRENGLIEGE